MVRKVTNTLKICSGKCCCRISSQIMLKCSHFFFFFFLVLIRPLNQTTFLMRQHSKSTLPFPCVQATGMC